MIVFAFLVAPTFISYQPYVFQWDDADYLSQAIKADHVFWSGTLHGMAHVRAFRSAISGIRPPAMTLLGVPWGPLKGWDSAGKCFISLELSIGIWAAICLYLLERIGVKPLLLIQASMCVGISLGPWPPQNLVNYLATGFMADSLFAWITSAAILLIPYESETANTSLIQAFLRGVVWGIVLSAGSMTKISFLYFVVLILPVLLIIRSRRGGFRSLLAASAGFVASAMPTAVYLLKYGGPSFENGVAASFGTVAALYDSSVLAYLKDIVRISPGLWCFVLLVPVALAYTAIKWRSIRLSFDLYALLIVVGFGMIVLRSPNHLLRFTFPVIVSVPFLLAIIWSRERNPVPRHSAILLSGLAAIIFIVAALPSRSRPERQSLLRADAVLAQAFRCRDKEILIATDSPTLNLLLLQVAAQISTDSPSPGVSLNALTWSPVRGTPLQKDYAVLEASDMVVFQDDGALSPPFTNLRVPSYRNYISQQSQFSSNRVLDDVTVFRKYCSDSLPSKFGDMKSKAISMGHLR